MKELDVLLGGFLEHRFDGLDDSCKTAFVDLIAQQDPAIADWIWGRLPLPDGALGNVIRMIRKDAGMVG